MDPIAKMCYAGNPALQLLPALVAAGIINADAIRAALGQDPGEPIGHRRDGRPIYAIAGGDDASLEARITELTSEIKRLGDTRQDAQPAAKGADGGRYAAALDGSKATADELSELARYRAADAEAKAKADMDAAVKAAVQEVMSSQTARSMAARIGDGPQAKAGVMALAVKAHPFLAGVYGDGYVAGEAVTAVAQFTGRFGLDPDVINAGKAKLIELGMEWMTAADGPNVAGKATLGNTSAGGGYVLPNNLVDSVVKPSTQEALYSRLLTVVPGVNVRGVDQPYRLGAPSRMTYANWGATKENVDESYGSYTANLVTFARIYDVGKQYLRFSAGAAERDVLDELSKAAALAENYEVMAGPGSGSVGSGDACLGIYTALNATPSWLGVKAAKTGSAASSTVVGSFVAALAEMAGILAGRNRRPSAFVVDATTYWTALAQGSDSAGFWASPLGIASGLNVDSAGNATFFGIPILYDTNLGTNAATKILIGAEWGAFKLYRGMEFRIDSSDQAGDRWDKNLVGFRGEMELGFNADTGVHVGAAQLMTAVIP